ncbi:MAG: tetratricopeptide repeat protein [Desulfobaccales bacterium]
MPKNGKLPKLAEWFREKVYLLFGIPGLVVLAVLAAAAYVYTDWARTQNNLGGALERLGERESDTQRLEEALAAFQEALKERTRERVPLDWAITHNNLGIALRILGERESGTQRLEEAVKAFKAALEVYEPAHATYYVEVSKSNLQKAEALLQKKGNK